jgi:rhamnopyranosyl-N-acetylglucosaminyl-diphospho-decaprenol beta-1,3/1,4-galactofuranosyltransferase
VKSSEPYAKGIAAVFVTMNRSAVAKACLDHLANQTLRPEKIIVINNASEDDTEDLLSTIRDRHPDWLEVVSLRENLGNAGGMEIALENVFSGHFDAAWILDDDSWPAPDALERLIGATPIPELAVRSSKVIDKSSGALSWPVQVKANHGWKLFEGFDDLPESEVIQIRRSWLGALISRNVYETVGPVNGRLFIRGEDEEYPRKIETAGIPVFMVSTSQLHHPPAGPMHHWCFAGHTIIMEKNLSGDRLYYRLRNLWWIIRSERGALTAFAAALLDAIALVRWRRSLTDWLPIWSEAFCDAMLNQLGKRGAP